MENGVMTVLHFWYHGISGLRCENFSYPFISVTLYPAFSMAFLMTSLLIG